MRAIYDGNFFSSSFVILPILLENVSNNEKKLTIQNISHLAISTCKKDNKKNVQITLIAILQTLWHKSRLDLLCTDMTKVCTKQLILYMQH